MSGPLSVRLDPRTKLALLFVWALAVLFSPGLPFEAGMMALAVVFGVLCGKMRLSVAMFALYCAAMGIAIALAQVNLGIFSTLFNSFFLLVRKVFPCGLLAAIIVSTTQVNEFMSAFSKMRCPREVTIPFAVMMRYVPAIREDWGFIKDAMRMRGVSPTLGGFLRRPGLTVECLYVPLMMSALNVADELSCASVARGIENPAPRTCYLHIEFGIADAAVAVVAAAVLATAIVLRGLA